MGCVVVVDSISGALVGPDVSQLRKYDAIGMRVIGGD